MWRKHFDDVIAKVYDGLRVTGEMACFFKHNLVDQLMEHERALHRVLDASMIAACACSARLLSQTDDQINLHTELIKAQGAVLFTGMDKQLRIIEVRKA